MGKKKSSSSSICDNRRASFDYELLEKFEAGVELSGWEVKSLRKNRGQIVGAYVRWLGNELFLVGARIDAETGANPQAEGQNDRDRKLLLHRKEINKIKGSLQTKGLSCVPLNLHWKNHLVKCDIALARGKKLHDKRESIKKKDMQRDTDRAVKY
ncbi:MAG: SsrA-binding protein SmpB [Gammaproteobacteria bacterium]|nr:SsrA-binding protein SmpB [Gammaproteobacteria bacterium]